MTDDVLPVTGTVADNGFSNDATLTIAGTAEAGSTVTLYDTDGTTVLGTGVASGGAFSITTTALGQGSHTITAKATDTAGNQGAASTAYHVTIDTSAPAAPAITSVTDDVVPVTGTVADNGFSNDATLTIAGTAEAGSTVTLYDTDGTTVLGTGVASGGAFSITTTALGQGSHTITAKATDTAGNQGAASTAYHVTIDTSAPAAPAITSVTDDVLPVTGTVADNGFSNDATLTIAGTAEAGSTVTLYDTDGTTVLGTGVASGGAFSITTTALGQGSHTITAKATDTAGNQGAASTAYHVTIDTLAPAAPAITSVTDDVLPVTGALTSGGSTNDTDLTVRVSLSGTNAVAGDTLQLYNGTGTSSQLGTSYTITSGDISNGFADVQTGALSNGATYTITARVTDQAGNQSTASGSFIITEAGTAPAAPAITSVTDDVLPVTGTVADNGFSNDATLTIAGTAEAGSTVTLYDTDGTTVLGTGVASGGAFSITTTALGQGSHTITAKATDTAGNQGAASTAYHVTIDTSAPAAPAITSVTDDVLPVTGTVADNGFSNDATLTIAGTAEAGSTVTLYDTDGTTVLGTGVASGGAFSITTTALGQGSHTITAKATDTAGNQGAASTAYHVTIDTSAPAAPAITSVTDDVLPVTGTVADNGFSNDATLTIAGTAEAGSTVTLYDTDGTTVLGTGVASGGAFSITTTALGQGSHTITAKATDTAGNQGAASTAYHVTIDTSAPAAPAITSVTDDVLPVTGTVADNGFSNDATLTIAGTAEAGSTVTLYDTDGTTVLGTGVASGGAFSITTTALGQGSHTITAKATDTAGNQGAASTAYHVTIDTSAPAAPAITSVTDDVLPVTGTVADNGFSNDATLTIAGTAEAGSTVTLYDTDGTTVLGTGVASGGAFSITTTALGQGSHTITAKATDTAGNQGAASTAYHVTIDTLAPAAPAITSVTDDVLPVTGTVADNGFSNDATLTIAGTAEAGSTVTLYDTDGTTVLGTGVASGGAFSITTTALGQGSHTITAKATDTAGNQGAASTAYHVTIDTSAPAEILAITSIAGSSSPNVATITISGSNGALVNADKVQISGDDGVTWTDVVQTSPTNWTFADNVTRIANFNYRARIIDIAGNVGVTITQPVLVANNGGTISVVGPSSALVAKFTGTAGGTLQLGPSPGITGTVNAISIASGLIVISGNASITSGTGDAIDLTATGGTQGAPANLSINLTGPITGAASGIAAVQNAYGSITVNTSGPVIGLAGRGIYATQSATGVGSILVNVSGNVTGTGTAFSGIVAQNLNTANNADVTVAQTGNVTGGHDGIRAQTNGNGNVTVTTGANATITGITLYGIEAYSNGQGNITVTTASGDFINSGSVGINAYNQATSIAQAANSFISVTANGIINSGATYTGGGGRPAGILAGYKGGTTNTANSTAFGNVTVDNFATINAAGGDGIRAYNFGPGNVTIANHATIVARDFYGIAGSSSGSGNVVITTMSGSSITSGSHGILAINQATAIAAAEASTVTVTTASGDTINSGVHLSAGGAQPSGISAGYFGNGASNPNINGSVFVDNAANISARAGTGIAAFHFGYGNLSIIDRTGTSVSGAQFGISVGSSVSGTASPSNMSINVEGNATVMAGSLYGLAAISANNPTGGNTSISTGSGDVIRSGGTGINANVNASSTPAASTITITTQQGTITSGYNFFQGGGTPSGISAGYNGPLNTAVRGNVVLDNSATVKAVSGAGISLNNNGVGSITATLQAGSSVTGAQSGVNAFSAGGGNITVDNRGTITAGSIGINTGNGGSNPSSANGQISVINSGTVTGPGAPYMSVVSIGNVNSSQTATVGNGGTIAAGLFARTTNNVAISIYSGNGAITNSGTITGNVAFNANGNFTNAIGGIWNLNGWNNLGTGAPAINNAGTMNVSGWAFLSANGGPVALSNTSAINVAQNSVAQIFANVSGAGTISIGDRSAVEIGGSVAASQGFNIFGRGLLTFDNPASVGSNLPLNFTSSANGNLGSIISLIGGGISAANIAGSTLTVTGAFQSYLFQLSGSGVSGNYFDVLSSDRIILVPTTATIISNVTTSQSPATPANFYILDNDHIGGSGPGFNLQTNDAVATSAYTIVANANSDISVNGSNISGLRVATQGASGTIINAANVTTTGAGPTSGIVVDTTLSGNNFNGSADIVNYGNVSGVTNAIVANTVNGNVNIVTGFATLTGTNSYGIFGRASGSGGINIMTAGGTINAGLIGIAAFEAADADRRRGRQRHCL